MVYIIQENDTLFKIAQRYTGDGYRYSEILDINPQITNPDLIITGDMLNLPSSWSSAPATTPTIPTTPKPPSAVKPVSYAPLIMIGLATLAGAYWFLGAKKNPSGYVDEDFEDFEEDDE